MRASLDMSSPVLDTQRGYIGLTRDDCNCPPGAKWPSLPLPDARQGVATDA